jgi:AcrR family transcriptional regulator
MLIKRLASRTNGHVRKRDSEKTKRTILAAALREFAHHGYFGARIDRIARSSHCNIRMLYHYFGSKQGIYVAVLESAYDDIRLKEGELALDREEPLEGLLCLLQFTYDYFAENPLFEALLRNENLMRGKFVLRSKRVTRAAFPLRKAIADLLARGTAQGIFRRGIDPVQVYVTVAALSRFHLANAYSLSALLNTDLTTSTWRKRRFEHARELLSSYLLTGASHNRLEVAAATPGRAERRPLPARRAIRG